MGRPPSTLWVDIDGICPLGIVGGMAKVKLDGYRCDRCEHEWLPRDKEQDPKVCPKCKSRIGTRRGGASKSRNTAKYCSVLQALVPDKSRTF